VAAGYMRAGSDIERKRTATSTMQCIVLSANSVDTIAQALNRTTFAVRRRANTLRLPLRKIARLSQTDLIQRSSS
jgi:hypothetical protein